MKLISILCSFFILDAPYSFAFDYSTCPHFSVDFCTDSGLAADSPVCIEHSKKCTGAADLAGSPSIEGGKVTAPKTSDPSKNTQSSPTGAAPTDASSSGARRSLDDVAVNADGGAREATLKREKLDAAMLGAERYEQQTLQEAQRALRARAAQIARGTQGVGPEQSSVIHDAAVLDKISTKYQNEKPITLADADAAQIPEVREKLEDVFLTQRYGDKLAKDRTKLSEVINSLGALGALALQKADSLTSATGKDSGPLVANGKVSSSQAASYVGIAKKTTEAGEASSSSPAGDEAPGSSKMLLAVAGMKSVNSSSLRDRMKKKLALARAAEDAKLAALKSAGGKDMFEGGLSKDGAASASDSTKGAGSSLAAQAVSSALLSSSTEQQRFTLAGAETDAAVQKLMRNPSGTELAANDASVQAANSLSLFERVRVAHTHCLKQRCVQAN